jgi:hypothetical protein
VGPTFVYSHFVVGSKFPMFPIAKRRGDPRLFMAIEDKEWLLVVVKKIKKMLKIELSSELEVGANFLCGYIGVVFNSSHMSTLLELLF